MKGENSMTFKEFKEKFQAHFEEMIDGVSQLFVVNFDKDELWNLYLDSFPAGKNDIFRKRREFDCSCCRHFVKQFGGVVAIKDGHMVSVWDFNTNDDTFQPVLRALSEYIHRHTICDVYFTKNAKIGTDHSNELTDTGNVQIWEHFSVDLPHRLVYHGRDSEGEYKNEHRSLCQVFKRSLNEISIDAVNTVLELIASNTLYRGAEWKTALEVFHDYKHQYIRWGETAHDRDLYVWSHYKQAGAVVGRIRNHSIGVLLTDISEGMDLERAVSRYENIVAPTNYKRPKAIYTRKMLEEAQKKVVELGYMNSLPRRHANLNDISVNNILFCNRDVAGSLGEGTDVFATMIKTVDHKPMDFNRVEEIGIDKFISDVLPTARDVEVYLENRHAKNMVSLIAPQNPEAPSMFKWNNNFGWAYAGNVTDSLKENVKAAGGKVDGVLRFSIQWNDEDYNPNDFDAHCVTPTRIDAMGGRRHYGAFSRNADFGHIYYGHKQDVSTGGELDVDIITPRRGTPAVENITWPIKDRMVPGTYQFYVNCYSNNGGRSGFKAEIEFDGKVYSFEYPKELRHGETVRVADVILDNNGIFDIKLYLDSSTSSRDIWNLKTNHFIPVSVMMYSPNYWDEQVGIGHKHCFFMLKDCVNPESPNGFYNEFLKHELVEHKRVFEALGGQMKVENTDNQLSGVGFSTTKRDDVIVRVTGATKRVMKIKF